MNFWDLILNALLVNLLIIWLITIFITTIWYFTVKFWNLLLWWIKWWIKISPIISITIILAILIWWTIVYKNPDNFKTLYNKNTWYK